MGKNELYSIVVGKPGGKDHWENRDVVGINIRQDLQSIRDENWLDHLPWRIWRTFFYCGDELTRFNHKSK
jgi:hypothetical protein